MNETQAEAEADIIGSASTNLMTKDDASLLRVEIKADAFRALWIQGIGIVAIVGTFIAIATALG